MSKRDKIKIRAFIHNHLLALIFNIMTRCARFAPKLMVESIFMGIIMYRSLAT
jgi:hypothetical protein